MIGAIIIGLIAGWLAGKLMRGQGYGFIGDVVLGLVGAVIGGWLFTRLGVPIYGALPMLATATGGGDNPGRTGAFGSRRLSRTRLTTSGNLEDH